MTWQDVAHHYQDYEEASPPAFERQSVHVARKPHHCENCEGWIEPGQRYSKYIYLDDEKGLQVLKSHCDPSECEAERARVEEWRARE